ncbi:Cyclin, A/B/D/E domain containing protein [Dorcoceras hygrometricum]|uniref:Cyclin, A/B/D/E domain containing protein n=1 Tax=Dorcoceras hygrometricum TaxID=472368 RepID=A0A2Z6ZW75_9LAMI|nr:Cyclin, A/B/D/E domain containing protein [Dorcoceras hygrometricum]
MKASGESSTTKHRLLHASGPHPIPPPNDPKSTTGDGIPSSACTRRPNEIGMDGLSLKDWPEKLPANGGGDGD